MTWMDRIKWNPFNNKNNNIMNYEKISAAVGRTITAENFNSLTQEEVLKMESALAGTTKPVANAEGGTDKPESDTPPETPKTDPEPEEEEQTLEKTISAAVQKSVAAAMAPFEARLQTLEGNPAAEATGKPKVNPTPEAELPSWQRPDSPTNKYIDEALGK